MMRIGFLVGLAALAAQPVQAEGDGHAGHAAHQWTAYPLLQKKMAADEAMRGAALLTARNMESGRFDAWAADGQLIANLPITLGGAALKPLPKVGNYYWLAAREETPERVSVAASVNFFSNPGPAPRAMLLQPKYELEIVPQPLPREHSGYRANEDWKFLVRFNGHPLANQRLVLDTAGGSHLGFMSDAQGMATVHFPDDFKAGGEAAAEPHRHGPRRADFVLATEHDADGRHYLSSFNYSYGPDAYDKRSLVWGAGFTLVGMTLATPLLRRREKRTVKSDSQTAGQGE